MTGTVIAQLMSIAFSPVISRLYSPEEFGLFTIISSIYALIVLISGGRYEVALMVPKRNVDAINLLGLSFFVNLGFLLLSYLVLFVLPYFGLQNKLGFWYYLLPVFVFLIGFGQCLMAWNNRRKKYRSIVNFRITQSLLNNVFPISNSLLKVPVNGILLGYLGSAVISLGVILFQIKADFALMRKGIRIDRMLFMAKKYSRFPLINALQALLDAIQINGLIYVISFLFGNYQVGIFSLAIRILFVPMSFAGSSIAQVFYQEANSNIHNKKPLMPLLKRTIKMNCLLILPVLFILLLFGPQLFSFVYGKEWMEAGVYAQYLCVWICIDFVRAPLSQIPTILNKQHALLISSIVNNVLLFGLLFLGSLQHYNLKTLLLIISALQVLYILALIVWIITTAREDDAKRLNL
jgi:O-antigen/teichoic acid export membrane protein